MKSNIIFGILIFIGIILVAFLIWNQFNYLNEKIILENEYGYNAIKLTHTDNTITETRYMESGNPVKYVDTVYIEDGRISKMVEEKHYNSINSAKEAYELAIKNSSNSIRTVSIKRNVITYTHVNPEVTTDDFKEFEFTSMEQLISMAEETMQEMYPQFTRVY